MSLKGDIEVKVQGLPGSEIYFSSNEKLATGTCREVYDTDGGLSVLNIKETSVGIQVTCGYILENGLCGYLNHVKGKDTKCALLETMKVVQQRVTKKQVA